MIDANVAAKRYGSEFLHPPAEIGVFAERQIAECNVEAVHGMENLREQEEVRGHKSQTFETLVGHRAPLRLAFAFRGNEPLDSEDIAGTEFVRGVQQPVRHRLAVVVNEGNNLATRELGARVARETRATHIRAMVEQVQSRISRASLPRVDALVDNDGFEIAEGLTGESPYKPRQQAVALKRRNNDGKTGPLASEFCVPALKECAQFG